MCILKSKSPAADLPFGATEIKTANSEVPDELRNLEKIAPGHFSLGVLGEM